MDLPLILFGLATGGYLLNKKEQGKTNVRKASALRQDRYPNHNILDHKQFRQVQGIEESRAAKRFQQAHEGGSKIVPFYYRNLEASTVQRTKNPDYDPNALPLELQGCGSIQAMAGGALPSLDRVAKDGLLEGADQNWAPIPYNVNNEIDQGPVRGHNNMVPFFGSNVKQNINPESVLAAKKLEDFTGARPLDRARKQEVETLFAPVAQNLDQLVPLREKDRIVPSNLGVRNNELPFKQETVGPGLNAGYTSTPSGGFHNPVRIMPKDNDALHVNPRTTHEGRVIRGKNPVDARTAQSLMYKYQPETLVTNFDGERNMVTTGAVKNPTARPEMELKPTGRQQFTEHFGGRGREIFNTPENLFSKVKPSDRQNFKNTPFRNLEAVGGKRHAPDHTYNYENRRTERSVTGPRHLSTLSNLKAAAWKAYTAFFDNAKKTRAESYVDHPRSEGNIEKGRRAGPVYNEASVAKSTGRELHETNTHTGHLHQADGAGKGPVSFPDNARTTTRELNETNSHSGQLKGARRTKILNTNDQARTTHRETNGVEGYQGTATGIKKGQVYNESSVARTTGRETLENGDYLGGGVTGKRAGKTPLIDNARTTGRETVDAGDYLGGVTQGRRAPKTKIVDQARTTHRETLEGGDYLGGVNQGRQAPKTQVVDTARTTHRETVDGGDYLGGVGQGRKAPATQLTDGARTTTRETTQSEGKLGGAKGRKAPRTGQTDNARTTHRETVDGGDYLGGLGTDGRRAPITQLVDQARTTTRETTQSESKLGGAKGRKAGRTGQTDVARTTHRETLESGDYLGNVGGNSKKAPATQLVDTARTTIRETTQSEGKLGGVGRGRKAPKTQQVDQARTTHRETLDGGDYLGGIGAATADGRRAPVTGLVDQARTTHRETTQSESQLGGVGRGRRAPKTQQVDPARTTHRETLDGGDYLGAVGAATADGRRAPTTQHIDQARTTHRETHEDAERIGPAQDPNLAGGQGYLTAKFEDKPTQRQFSHFSYTGNAAPKGLAESQRLYDDAYNARQNVNKEVVAQGRSEQNGYLPLHSGKTFTNINIKKLETDRKNHYGFAANPVFPNGRIPESQCRLTSFKNNPPSEYSRLDTSLVESLLDNPLHKSLHSASGP